MIRLNRRLARTISTLVVLTTVGIYAALAQAPTPPTPPPPPSRIQLNNFDKLEAKASHVVDISLDERLIRLGLLFLKNDRDFKDIRELVAGLKGVYVRSYEFDRAGEFTEADIAQVRTQLKRPGWERVVGVTSRRGENTEVYLMTEGERISGVTVLTFEERELTIVNIVGHVDLEKLSLLEGRIGIPRLDLVFPKRSEEKKQP